MVPTGNRADRTDLALDSIIPDNPTGPYNQQVGQTLTGSCSASVEAQSPGGENALTLENPTRYKLLFCEFCSKID